MSKRSNSHMTRNVHGDTKEVAKQIKELGGASAVHRLSRGAFTRKLLKKRKVVSPNTSGKIKIKAGLWILPKKKINTELQKQKFIESMKQKFNII